MLSHDKQVEDVARIAATEEEEEKRKKDVCYTCEEKCIVINCTKSPPLTHARMHIDTHTHTQTTVHPPSRAHSAPSSVEHSTDSASSTATTNSSLTPAPAMSSSSYINSQILTEKTKLMRKIREYNRKTTPVHHIHMKSSVSVCVCVCVGAFMHA